MSYLFDENASEHHLIDEEVKAEKLPQIDAKVYDEQVRKLYENNKKDLFEAAAAFDEGTSMNYIRKGWDLLPRAAQWLIYKNPIFKVVGILPVPFAVQNMVEFGFIDYKGHETNEEFANDVEASGVAKEFMLKVAQWILEDPESQAFLKLAEPIVKAQNEMRKEICIELRTHLKEERVMRQEKEALPN